jgi:hypothetical protein
MPSAISKTNLGRETPEVVARSESWSSALIVRATNLIVQTKTQMWSNYSVSSIVMLVISFTTIKVGSNHSASFRIPIRIVSSSGYRNVRDQQRVRQPNHTRWHPKFYLKSPWSRIWNHLRRSCSCRLSILDALLRVGRFHQHRFEHSTYKM